MAENQGPISGSYWVNSDKLIAGPYPAPWFVLGNMRRDLQPLLDAGVTYFLDLTEEGEVRAYAPTLEKEAEAHEIEVVHQRMAIVDMDVPSIEFMREILDTLDVAVDAGHTVYVHCLGGIGRTGTVVGCWLVRHGMAGEAALQEIVRLRDGRTNSPQTPEQFEMVRAWREW